MKKIFAYSALFLMLAIGSLPATTVLFTLQSLTGQVNNRQILVQPDQVQNPLVLGTNIVPIFDFVLQPANGQVVTNLAPWGYTIKVDGWPRSAHIIVPDTNITLNVATLINTNAFAPLNIYFFANLLASNNIALVTNPDGSIWISATGAGGSGITNNQVLPGTPVITNGANVVAGLLTGQQSNTLASLSANAVTNTQSGVSLGGSFSGILSGNGGGVTNLNINVNQIKPNVFDGFYLFDSFSEWFVTDPTLSTSQGIIIWTNGLIWVGNSNPGNMTVSNGFVQAVKFTGDASSLTNQNVSLMAKGNTSTSNNWVGTFNGGGTVSNSQVAVDISQNFNGVTLTTTAHNGISMTVPDGESLGLVGDQIAAFWRPQATFQLNDTNNHSLFTLSGMGTIALMAEPAFAGNILQVSPTNGPSFFVDTNGNLGGDGIFLTNLNASALSSGTVSVPRLPGSLAAIGNAVLAPTNSTLMAYFPLMVVSNGVLTQLQLGGTNLFLPLVSTNGYAH